MSSSATADRGEESLLAAEYVLRLLLPDEERAFERRLQSDRSLLRDVAEWTTRFSGMDSEVEGAAPHRRVKAALEARLFGAGNGASWLQRIGLWQGLSAASLAMVGLLAFQVMQGPQVIPQERGPIYVSEVMAEDQSLRILAVYDGAAGELQLSRTAGAAQPGRALELWAIADGAAPVSLGVLPEDGKAVATLPQGVAALGLTLAISDEPIGGSPTGQPTGAVLAAGQISEI